MSLIELVSFRVFRVGIGITLFTTLRLHSILAQKRALAPKAAIVAFNSARCHSIQRPNYIADIESTVALGRASGDGLSTDVDWLCPKGCSYVNFARRYIADLESRLP